MRLNKTAIIKLVGVMFAGALLTVALMAKVSKMLCKDVQLEYMEICVKDRVN